MTPEIRMVAGLIVGIVFLILVVLKTRVHAFLAMIAAAAIIGIVGGMPLADIPGAITGGFGSTLGSIGIVIGFGVMMGQLMERSGAAERMALTFIKLFGKKREHWAMAVTGFIASIPIFCDSAFVVLQPIAKAISKKTGRSIVAISTSLAAGLVVTHSLVPPTPGPLGVAGTFGVDVGIYILVSLVFAILPTIAAVLYAQWYAKKLYQIPADDGEGWIRPEEEIPYSEMVLEESKELPSTFNAFLPILLPIFLILLNNLAGLLKLPAGIAKDIITFLGTPIIAVGFGLLVAIYVLCGKLDKKEALDEMNKGIKSAGLIILVTGAGGALGNVLKVSGTGNFIAEQIAATPIPLFLLPFVVSTLVRFVQGSGTVAMTTAAGICAPIIQAAGGNLLLGVLAACTGSLFFGYFNDSYFWVVNNMMGISETKEQIRNWSITSTIAWAVAFVELLVLGIFMK